MRIHVLYTGGTIGMIETPHGFAPGADVQGWLERVVSGTVLSLEPVALTALGPAIDSSCATPESWQAIIDFLRANRDGADAFVVLHGTDTMAYSSAALSYALTGFGKPVVLTGSQLPLGFVESDAATNVTGALTAAMDERAQSSVGLFFGQHLYWGNRVTKASTWAYEAFDSPMVGPWATTGAPWLWNQRDGACRGWENPAPYTRQDVAVIDMVPGISAQRVRAALNPMPAAVLLRAYGVGNVPCDEPGLVEALAACIEADVPVIVASQCSQANVLVGRYAAADALARAGAVGTLDMTFEAAYAKIVFLLSQGLRGSSLILRMGESIAGELTEQE